MLRRRLGQWRSSLQFLNTVSGLVRATAFFIVHTAYLVARSLSRQLRPVGDVSQWKVVVTSDREGDQRIVELVGQYLNNYNVVAAYNTARGRTDDMDSFIDTCHHSLLGTVTRGRFHEVIKTVEWDPRYAQFTRSYDKCQNDEERARCICVWVTTMSVHLLKLLDTARRSTCRMWCTEFWRTNDNETPC